MARVEGVIGHLGPDVADGATGSCLSSELIRSASSRPSRVLTLPSSIRIDGEALRLVVAPSLSRPVKGEDQLLGLLANLVGSCYRDPRCSSGGSLGEAEADAPR